MADDQKQGNGPDAAEIISAFEALQTRLPDRFVNPFAKTASPRTVVIVPSLSLDQDVLSKISGISYYEERMLCLLLILRNPDARVVYVTSSPIAEPIIDYYLHLLPGIPARHARRRLRLLACHDSGAQPLTEKILSRPRLIERLQRAIRDRETSHMVCFNVSDCERSLAVTLGIPIYGCDPALLSLGSKSGGRKLMREADILIPEGFEDLSDAQDISEALAALKTDHPDLAQAVVKLNDGFSGEGNAVFRYNGAPARKGKTPGALRGWVEQQLPDMLFEASDMGWDAYHGKLNEMGGIVEAFVDGGDKRSPSAQFRIAPSGTPELISTHDQLLGGTSGHTFIGAHFPADAAYRLAIQDEGRKVAQALGERGVRGRFGVDFISVREGHAWRHYGIEINLRWGGTTHPFMILQFLTDGGFDAETGKFFTPSGQERVYFASDNLASARYRGLTPDDLIDIAVANGLHFHGATQQGVVFHLIGALSEFGKLGIVCVAETAAEADALYKKTVKVLDREGPGGS